MGFNRLWFCEWARKRKEKREKGLLGERGMMNSFTKRGSPKPSRSLKKRIRGLESDNKIREMKIG